MSDPSASPAAAGSLRCPRCAPGRVPATDGEQKCMWCRRSATVFLFDPVPDAFTAAGAAGRCARHPNKDAVAGCSRCGSFVCDVCATRTGEELYCTACFETLHERQHLSTTRVSRMRWDDLTLGCGLLSLAICPLACVGTPVTLALGGWTLSRIAREPWLSRPRTITGMVLSLPGLATWVFMFPLRNR